MSGEKFVEKATEALQAAFNSGFATQLRAVETEQSLTANSLEDPVAIVDISAPNDNRSPLIEVFHTSWAVRDQKEGIIEVDCVVSFQYLAKDSSQAGLEAASKFMKRYVTAAYETVANDATLGSVAIGALISGGSSGVTRGDSSVSRFIETLDITVLVHDP